MKHKRYRGGIEKELYDSAQEWLSEEDRLWSSRSSGIFSEALTVWLMVVQRLNGGSLRDTQRELLAEYEGLFVTSNSSSKPLRFKEIPDSTGGLTKARQRLQLKDLWELFEQSSKNLFKKVESAYFLDGMTITTAHSEDIVKTYGQHRVAQGTSHYPKVQLVTAHGLDTGAALVPEIGTIKENEVCLGIRLLERIKKRAFFIADRGFGIFRVAYAAHAQGHTILCRLKEDRAKALVGSIPSKDCVIDCEWSASKDVQEKFPELQNVSAVPGRFIRYTSYDGKKPLVLYFFTTSTLSAEKLVQLYKRRQEIETQIGYIKQTLSLEFVRSKSAEMVQKEIAIAFLTYNLLNSILFTSALLLKTDRRMLSFKGSISLIKAYAKLFLNATSPAELRQLKERFIRSMYRSRNPTRKKRRSYPRVIRSKNEKYPRAGTEETYKKLAVKLVGK